MEARTLAHDGCLRLGLQKGAASGSSIQDADCSIRPLFPALSTFLAELLKSHALDLNWTSFEVYFRCVSDVTGADRMAGIAAAFTPWEETGGEAENDATGHEEDHSPIGSCSFLL